MTQSLGDAKVYCLLSGELIENDEQTSGKPRFHCLDMPGGVDYSVDGKHIVERVISLGRKLLAANVPGAEKNFADRLSHCYAFNPSGADMNDLFDNITQSYIINDNQSGDDYTEERIIETSHIDIRGSLVWAEEKAHFFHLRNAIDRPLLNGFQSSDTPAGFISRAFDTYAHRLALGIPDPKWYPSLFFL